MKIRGEDTLCKGPGAGKKACVQRKEAGKGSQRQREEREREMVQMGLSEEFVGAVNEKLWGWGI